MCLVREIKEGWLDFTEKRECVSIRSQRLGSKVELLLNINGLSGIQSQEKEGDKEHSSSSKRANRSLSLASKNECHKKTEGCRIWIKKRIYLIVGILDQSYCFSLKLTLSLNQYISSLELRNMYHLNHYTSQSLIINLIISLCCKKIPG